MENLITLMAICCTISGAFITFMPWTGTKWIVINIKLLGFITLVSGILYWINYFKLLG